MDTLRDLELLQRKESALLKQAIKQYIDANCWDGEDRSGCANDRATFDPDDLQELCEDLVQHIDHARRNGELG